MIRFIRAQRQAMRRALLAASVLAGVGVTPALAVDVDAGDYTVVPAGVNLAIGYFVYAHRSELDARGAPGGKVPNSQLDSEIGIARFVHYFDVAGIRANVQVIAPFGSLNGAKIGGSDVKSASGLGDTIFGFTLYPLDDTVNKRSLGVTTFIQVPVGQYSRSDTLSLGANRYTGTIQAGFIQGLGDRFLVDLDIDAGFKSDNTDVGATHEHLSTTPTYEIQPWLRYKPSAGSEIAVGYVAYLGGLTKVTNVLGKQSGQSQAVRLQGLYFLSPTLNLQAILSRDVQVDDGFRRDISAQVRILKIF